MTAPDARSLLVDLVGWAEGGEAGCRWCLLSMGHESGCIVAEASGFLAATHASPGDHHRYRVECEVCGQRGTIILSIEPQRAGPEPLHDPLVTYTDPAGGPDWEPRRDEA